MSYTGNENVDENQQAETQQDSTLNNQQNVNENSGLSELELMERAINQSIDNQAIDLHLDTKGITQAQYEEADNYDVSDIDLLATGSDTDKKIEEQQDWMDQLGRAVGGGIYKGTMTFLENVGYVADVPQWFGFTNSFEDGYTNWLSEMASEEKERFEEYNPIYGDDGWAATMRGLQGLVDSTVGFAGIGSGAGALIGRGTMLLNQLIKAGKITEQMVARIGTAAATNYAESTMMAAEMHKEIMDNAAKNNVNYEKALEIANQQTKEFIWQNKINLATDMIALRSMSKGEGIISGAMEKSLKKKAAEFGKDVVGEAFEEMSAGFLQKENTRDANIEMGIENDTADTSYLKRMGEYAISEEVLTEGLMGAIGGPFQHYTLKAFNKGLEVVKNKVGITDPVANPGEFTEEKPSFDLTPSKPVGKEPLNPVDKYLKTSVNTTREEAEKYVTEEDWEEYRKERQAWVKSGVTDGEYEKAYDQYKKDLELWEKKKKAHDMKKESYQNYMENRKIGKTYKAKEDIQNFMKKEAELLVEYKNAVLNGDKSSVSDIENQRFEGLFARYAQRGMTEGLEKELKEIQISEETTPEQKEFATRQLKKFAKYKQDYMSMYNKHGAQKGLEMFRLKARIDNTKEAISSINKDIDNTSNKIIGEMKELNGKNVNPLQLELMATKAEMAALEKLKNNLPVQHRIALEEKFKKKQADVEAKVKEIDETLLDGKLPEADITTLDSYKDFEEKAAKKMDAWITLQGMSKAYEFESSPKSQSLLNKKNYDYMVEQIDNSVDEVDVYSNLAMLKELPLSKSQRKDLLEKLDGVAMDLRSEEAKIKENYKSAKERLAKAKEMKADVQKSTQEAVSQLEDITTNWISKENKIVDDAANSFNEAKANENWLASLINKVTSATNTISRKEAEDQMTYEMIDKLGEGAEFVNKESLLQQYRQQSENAYRAFKEAKALKEQAIIEKASMKVRLENQIELNRAQEQKIGLLESEAQKELESMDVNAMNDPFYYRADEFLDKLRNGDSMVEEDLTEDEEDEDVDEDTKIKKSPSQTLKEIDNGDIVDDYPDMDFDDIDDDQFPNVDTDGKEAKQEPSAKVKQIMNQAGVPKKQQSKSKNPLEFEDGEFDATAEDFENNDEVDDFSEPEDPAPAKGKMTPDEMNVGSQVIKETVEKETGDDTLSGALSHLSTTEKIDKPKKLDEIPTTDVENPDKTPPVSNDFNDSQEDSEWENSISYMSTSDGKGQKNNSGLVDWLETTTQLDKEGTKVRFEVVAADGNIKNKKGEFPYKKVMEKYQSSGLSSMTEKEIAKLPIRMVMYKNDGTKLIHEGKEVYGWLKSGNYNFKQRGNEKTQAVMNMRSSLLEAFENGENYETQISKITHGKLQSDSERKDPRDYINFKSENNKSGIPKKILVSNGIDLVDSSGQDGKKDRDLPLAVGTPGFMFLKVRSANGKAFPLKLNSRRLNPDEVNTIVNILVNYSNNAKPSDMAKVEHVNGLRNREILDLLIFNGSKSLNNEYPFNVELKGKKSALVFGKKKIPLSKIKDPAVQKEVGNYLATMWRTTNAKMLNKKMNQTVERDFKWFGNDIDVGSMNYNDFQFNDEALSTNASFPNDRLFINPAVTVENQGTWKKVGSKKTKATNSKIKSKKADIEKRREEIEKITDPEKRKSAEIEFIMANLFAGVGESSANKIREYADRIISGQQTRRQVIQGLPKSFVKGIDALLNANSQNKNTLLERLQSLPLTNENTYNEALEIINNIDFNNEQSISEGISKLANHVAGKDVSATKQTPENYIRGKEKLIGNSNFKTKEYLQNYVNIIYRDFAGVNTKEFFAANQEPNDAELAALETTKTTKTKVQQKQDEVKQNSDKAKPAEIKKNNAEEQALYEFNEIYATELDIFKIKYSVLSNGQIKIQNFSDKKKSVFFNKPSEAIKYAKKQIALAESQLTSDQKQKATVKATVKESDKILVPYTVNGKTQYYIIQGNKILNQNFKEVYSKPSKVRNKIFANYQVLNGNAVVVKDSKGNEYVHNKKGDIMSVKTGEIMNWPDNHGTRKQLNKLAKKAFRGKVASEAKNKVNTKKVQTPSNKPQEANEFTSLLELNEADDLGEPPVFDWRGLGDDLSNEETVDVEGVEVLSTSTSKDRAQAKKEDVEESDDKKKIVKRVLPKKSNPKSSPKKGDKFSRGTKYSVLKDSKKKADIEKELEIIQRILPGVPVEVANTLIGLPTGGVAEGKFYNGVVTIANGANEGIVYHEGFHAVLDGYLTSEERFNLFEEGRERFGEKSDLEIEEILAEEFREYMLAKGELRVPKVFRWIYNQLLDLVNLFRSDKNKIFSKIRAGRFNGKPHFSSSREILYSRLKGGPSTGLVQEAIDTLTYRTISFSGIRSMDDSGKKAYKNIDDILKDVRDSIIEDMEAAMEEENWEVFDNLATIVNEDKNLDNWDTYKDLIKTELASYGLENQKKDYNQVADENEDNVDGNLNIKPAIMFSGKDNATHNTRLMVAMLQDPNKQAKFLGPGFERLADASTSWRILEDSLAGIVDTPSMSAAEQMLERVKQLAKTHPQFNELVAQLTETDNDVVPMYKKTQFYRAFSKQKVIYNHATIQKDGDKHIWKIGNADSQSHAKVLRTEWSENFKDKFVDGNRIINHKELKGVVDDFKRIGVFAFNTKQNTFDPNVYAGISKLFGELGIDISPQSLRSYVLGKEVYEEVLPGVVQKDKNADEQAKFKTAFIKNILPTIVSDLTIDNRKVLSAKNNPGESLEKMIQANYEFDDENSFISSFSIFQRFATSEGLLKKDTLENMVLGPDGNMYWTKSLNNHISKTTSLWKNDKVELAKMLNRPYHNKSRWIKYLMAEDYANDSREDYEIDEESKGRLSDFTVEVFLSNRIEDSDDQGTSYSDITMIDGTIDSVNRTLNGMKNEKGSIFSPLTLADKSSFFMFSGIPMEKFNIPEEGLIPNKAVNIMYEYFLAEIERYSNSLTNESGNGYFDNKGSKELFWFTELSPNSKIANEIKLYDSEGIPQLNKEGVQDAVKDHIKQSLEKNFEKVKNTLSDMNVIQNDEIYGLDESIKVAYQNKIGDSPIDVANNVVLDYMMNSMISNIEFTMLYTGDPAFYSDLSKRTPSTSGQGNDLMRQPSTKPEGSNEVDGSERSFNIAVLEDSDQKESDLYEDYVKAFVEMSQDPNYEGKRYTKAEAESLLKPYRENELNRADGQAYITPNRYKSLMIQLGRWETRHEEAFKKLMNGENVSPEDLLSMQPLKGMHYELRDENGFLTPTYMKYSQAVLWPALVKGTENEKMLNAMEKDGIDEMVYESGIKVGSREKYSKSDITSGRVKMRATELSNFNWKLQQDLPTKYQDKGKALVGSQVRKNIFANILERGKDGKTKRKFTFRGKTMSAEQMVKAINVREGMLSDIGKEQFDEKYGVENGTITNQDAIYKHLISKFKRDKVDSNIIEQLEKRIPLSLIFQYSEKIEQEIFAELKKATVKLTSPGGSFIQISGEGFAGVKSYKGSNFDKHGIIPLVDQTKLRGPRKGKNGTYSAEVYLPFRDVEKIPNWENMTNNELIEALGDTVKNIVGYRIPNQNMASIDKLDIVGILPPEAGDSMIVYDEITAKTGSDFDIDKMYVMMYNTIYNPKSKRLERLHEGNVKYAVDYEVRLNKNNNPEAVIKNRESSNLELTKKIIENERLELWASVIESSDTFTDLVKPLDSDWLRDDAYYLHLLSDSDNHNEFISWLKDSKNKSINLISELRNVKDYKKHARDFYKQLKGSSLDFANPITQAEIKSRNMAGKTGVGQTANQLTHHNILHMIDFAEVYNEDGETISDVISALLNAYVDNAKDPYISLINHNVHTANTVFFLLRQGISPEKVNRLMSLPRVKEYIKNVETSNSKLLPRNYRNEDKFTKVKVEDDVITAKKGQTGLLDPLSKVVMDNEIDVSGKLKPINLKNINVEQLENIILGGDEKTQDRLFLTFIKAQDKAKKFTSLVTTSKFDTDGAGSGMAEYISRKAKIAGVMKGEFAGLFMKTMDNTFIGSMKRNSYDVAQKLMSNLFVTGKKETVRLVEGINEVIGQKGTDVELNKKILNAYNSYLFSAGMKNPDVKSLFYGENSMARRVRRMKNKFPTNPLLNALGTKLNTKKGEPSFVTFPSSKKRDKNEKDILWAAWEELLYDESTKGFAEDLIKYAYSGSGFQKNINSFYDLIPNTYFTGEISQENSNFNTEVGKALNNAISFDSFHDQFVRHNYDNYQIVPSLSIDDSDVKNISKSLTKYNKGFKINPKNLTDNFFIGEEKDVLIKYITLRNKSGEKMLFKQIGYKNDEYYYERVSALGMKDRGNNIVEYSYDENIENSKIEPIEKPNIKIDLTPIYKSSIIEKGDPLVYKNETEDSFEIDQVDGYKIEIREEENERGETVKQGYLVEIDPSEKSTFTERKILPAGITATMEEAKGAVKARLGFFDANKLSLSLNNC